MARDNTLVENGDDPWVNDSRGRACLSAKARDEVLGIGKVGVHDLEGNGTVKALVLRDVHRRHATAGKPTHDPVSFVDQEADQRIGLVECLFIAHLVDSMGSFAQSTEMRVSERRRLGVVLRS